MELYLIRHGIAEEHQLNLKDEERQLTTEGRQKTEKVAQKLAKLELDFGSQIKDGPSAETELTNLEQGKKLVSGQPQTKAGGRRASGIYVTNAKVGGKNSNDPARSDFSLDHFRSICL